MRTSLNVNWSAVVAVLGSFGVMGLMLVLIAYVQLWRHRIRRTLRDSARLPLDAGIMRDPPREMKGEERMREFLENADFSNEGNPNYGWKDRFLERSF